VYKSYAPKTKAALRQICYSSVESLNLRDYTSFCVLPYRLASSSPERVGYWICHLGLNTRQEFGVSVPKAEYARFIRQLGIFQTSITS